MPKFGLEAKVTISIYTTVEADTLEEAIQLAEDREIENYSFHERGQSDRCWVSDDFDGMPVGISLCKGI